MKLVLVPIALVALAAPVLAVGPVYTTSGSYLLGDGLSAELLDACVSSGYEGRDSPQEGLDSNCVKLPGDYSDLSYAVTASDLTGTAKVGACFYDAARVYLGCPTDGVVPDGSAFVSLSSLTGYAVTWTLTVG